MAQPFIGEIRMFGGNFAPLGWMFCDGSILSISENSALFNLIGTTYGGDGQSTFALPGLQGRVPVHQGNGFVLAQNGGAENVTLNVNQLPVHTHPALASSAGGSDNPSGNFWANSSTGKPYAAAPPAVTMNTGTIGPPVGGSQDHDNMIPYVAITYIISLEGIYPSPT